MTAKTSEKLAKALDAVSLDELAERARADEFHDYKSPHDLPETMLIDLLFKAARLCPDLHRRQRIDTLRRDVIDGLYDASTEESDEWAASADGQAAFELLKKGR